jgi:hypothetical protein
VTVGEAAEGLELVADDGARVVLTAGAAGVYVRRDGMPVVPAKATCWADIIRRERELAAG